MNYLVIFEYSTNGTVWARVPDLPGCYSCGEKLSEAREHVKEAIELHLEGLKVNGQPIPDPSSFSAEMVQI